MAEVAGRDRGLGQGSVPVPRADLVIPVIDAEEVFGIAGRELIAVGDDVLESAGRLGIDPGLQGDRRGTGGLATEVEVGRVAEVDELAGPVEVQGLAACDELPGNRSLARCS